MSTYAVLLVYAAAFFLAVIHLYFFKPRGWAWHALSIAAALALGFAPPPPQAWRGQTYDLIMGFIFVFLLVWGIGGTIAHTRQHARHA